VLITIGATQSKINRLYFALENIEKGSGRNNGQSKKDMLSHFKLTLSPMKFRPRYAFFYCEGEKIMLRDAKDRVSTAMVVPYPPGIPLLVPGQLITEEIIEILEFYRDYGVEIHGLNNSEVIVIKKEEEEELTRRGIDIKDITL
jgi:arginine/lysine/ornithine decarboxylase